MVTADDFPDFFAAVNGGRRPFSWQRRLVDYILTGGRWPDRIAVPTGAGKSSVIEVHVFVTAAASSLSDIRPPRRLIAAVDRRALVDNQLERAERIQKLLTTADSEILRRVRSALLVVAEDSGDTSEPSGLLVVSLRGGQPNTAAWRDAPATCGVICATPDMWGSRILFRGYGSSLRARPRDAGLLSVDAVIVLDEAHLNQQLLRTARRIGSLQNTAQPLGVPGLQVVETTATPTSTDGSEIAVLDEDLAATTGPDEILARRLLAPKPLDLVACPEWPGTSAAAGRAVARVLTDRARALKSGRAGTVGVFVNTVNRAIEVAELLRATPDRAVPPPTVVVVVGPMRPHDRISLQDKWKDLLTVEGNSRVDYLVATQTLEVGVDLDLSAAVSEMAPADAIVQRVGRVNRLGEQADPRVEIVVPESVDSMRLDRVGPYLREDLIASLAWLHDRSSRPEGLAAWSVSREERPSTGRRRELYQRLEAADAMLLAATSEPLFDEFDLDLWLHDDLDPDDDQAFLVVRDRLPVDINQALAVLTVTPPRPAECFPVTIGTLRQLLNTEPQPLRSFRFRSQSVEEFSSSELRPGDIVVVDSSCQVIREGVVHGTPNRAAEDVFESTADSAGSAPVRIMPFTDRRADERDPYRILLKQLDLTIPTESRDTVARRRDMADLMARALDEVVAVLDSAEGEALTRGVRHATAALRRAKYLTEIAVGRDAEGDLAWVVITPLDRRLPSALRQVVSPNTSAVPLDQHADAVAGRAAQLGRAVGVVDDLVVALEWAGRHHDDGKCDQRFQAILRGPLSPSEGPVLAKSGRTRTVRARREQTQLNPAGWRHEQLSVVIASRYPDTIAHHDLGLRLVGTSHGLGRPFFPHSAVQLIAADDGDAVPSAVELFDRGGWDDLIEATHARWGVWGCAYLEALLRAADCQVSAEGS